jgi:ribonuclease HII
MPDGGRTRPDLRLEQEALAAGHGSVAGVDEVGRGPWAGPVVAAAVVLHAVPDDLRDAVDDSKRLTKPLRERLHDRLLALAAAGDAAVGLGSATVAEIDALNVLGASLLAMRRAVAALAVPPALVLVDGNRCPDGLPCGARAVVGGDGISLSIAAASIVAKVNRDRMMAELARAHPGYGWERNAGYGTAEHSAALARLGTTPHHRTSFSPVRKLLESQDS